MSSAFDLDRIGGRRALEGLISEVLGAGEEALGLFQQGAGARARSKPDRSPVTEADERVEERLRGYLSREFPEVGFLGEETGASTHADAAMRFVVDPIDGTRAFVRGLPSWSILVGLEAEGKPVVGIAFLPASADLYVAVEGQGCLGNGRPLRVSAVGRLEQGLIVHGGLHQFVDAGLTDLLCALAQASATQRSLGDFDGHRAVLHGRADAAVDPGLKPWDNCASAVMIREAGGVLTSFTGKPTIYGEHTLLSNGLVHAELLELVRSHPAAPDGPGSSRLTARASPA